MPRMLPAFQRIALAGFSAATVVLAGCSESTSSPNRAISPDDASRSESPDLVDETGRHVFHTKQWFENDARQNGSANGRGGGGGGGTGISYHGGQVLQAATNVVAVYWAASPIFVNGPAAGSGQGTSDGSLVGHFLRNLGGSSYFKINSTYTNGSGLAIVNAVNYTGYWANPDNAPSGTQSVSDGQMVAMLQSGFNSGALSYDSSTLYAIFTSGQVNLGGGFGTQYCAYHTHGTVTISGVPRTVLYAAMPYNYGKPTNCTVGGTPANGSTDPGADFEVNTLAHEIEETTTDLMGNAWFDTRGFENADKCAWTFGSTYTTSFGGKANMNLGGKDFLVQQNWVNIAPGGCSKGI